MIKVKYDVLEQAQKDLMTLSHEKIVVPNPFIKSMGMSVDAEKEILEILKDVCNTALPALCENTSLLLGVIINEFKKTDESVASEFDNAGEANAPKRSSQTPHEYQIKGRS